MENQAPYEPYALSNETIQEPPRSLPAALRKIGPGIILAGSIVGSGELLLTTALGAQYGFVFLWLILFSCVIKVFVQIELGRYAISSGKPTLAGLDDLPGPRLGTHWLVWWWFIMLLITVVQLGAMAGGVGQAVHLAFPQGSPWLAERLKGIWPGISQAIAEKPEHPWAVLAAMAAILLLLSGGYRRIERITTLLVAAVTLITVACVCMLPATGYPLRLGDLREGFSLDALFLSSTAIAAAFGAFGITGVGASELYAYPYWCLEKGYARFTGPCSPDPRWVDRAKGWLRVMYLDAWVSMVVFTTATVAFYLLGATVLHRQGLHPEKGQMIATLAEMYVPAFGEWTKIFFLIGVWAVLFKTLYVASAANSRLTADFLGLVKAVRYRSDAQRHWWTGVFCVIYPAVGLLLYLYYRDPKLMVIIGGFVQAATLPIIAGAALYLRYRRTDPRLAPSRWSDFWLWFAFVTITIVAVFAIDAATGGNLMQILTGGKASA
ncbi:MAG: Nramp family divalent metal transporter [Pirellulales bacterium]|nr:Nramp family divalent metal transporter [Pirellulales bacterium]